MEEMYSVLYVCTLSFLMLRTGLIYSSTETFFHLINKKSLLYIFLFFHQTYIKKNPNSIPIPSVPIIGTLEYTFMILIKLNLLHMQH